MPHPYQDPSLPVDMRVADLLGRMTLEEKIAQLSVRNGSAEPPATAARVNNETMRAELDSTPHRIPILLSRETSHGLNNAAVTSFPASIALASSFDEDLNYRVGRAIAKEAISQGIRQGLSPVLDICRDPRWGRQEETYGEDPYLTSRLGVAFINGLQNGAPPAPPPTPFSRGSQNRESPPKSQTAYPDLTRGILATPKHLVGYSASEGGKDNDPINLTPRDLAEVYLPPFEAAVREAHAQSIMMCFGALNGVPVTADPHYCTTLPQQWGFDGFIIDDCPGIQGLLGHHAAQDMKQATALAINAGIDRQFFDYCGIVPTQPEGQQIFQRDLLALVREGQVPESRITDAAAKVLRAKFKLGLFEHPFCDPAEADRVANDPAHKALAYEAALKSAVLLKNENNLLPLDPTQLKRIAVIGPNAAEGQLGDYSGTPTHVVSPLEGIREYLSSFSRGSQNRASSVPEVLHAKGCEILSPALTIQRFSVRLTGHLKIDLEGTYTLHLESNDGARLTIDGKPVITDWTQGPKRPRTATLHLTQGPHPLTIEYFRGTKLLLPDDPDPTQSHNTLRLSWKKGSDPVSIIPDDNYTLPAQSTRSIQAEGSGEGLLMQVFLGPDFNDPQPDQSRIVKDVDFNWQQASPILATTAEDHESQTIQEAVNLAKRSDVALLFLGETSSRKGPQQVAGEHFDRADLALTGSQQKLALAVAATNTPTVVILINSRSLAIPELAQKIPAILESWYPGQQGGHALAALLFGNESPSGKLPASLPRSAGQLPTYYARRPRMGWYIDQDSTPLYPFGHGLTYTTFTYTNLQITPLPSPQAGSHRSADPDPSSNRKSAFDVRHSPSPLFQITITLTNTGPRPATEVVQLYLEQLLNPHVTPAKWLKSFQRVPLQPNQSTQVTFTLTTKDFEHLDRTLTPQLSPGDYKLSLGGNAQSPAVTTTLHLP